MGKVPERNTTLIESGFKCAACEKIHHVAVEYKNVVLCFYCEGIGRLGKYKKKCEELTKNYKLNLELPE